MKRCIAALLTGRGNSTLKDKNVLSVLGHPLLWWPATAARHCCRITDFFCSSDDDAILSAAAECGYTGICRPAKLARPETQHADVIIHALEMMRSQGCMPDILVVLLANNGIVKSEWIETSIKTLEEDPTLSACVPVMEEMDCHPYRCKRIDEDGLIAPWFDFAGRDISTNRQDLPKNYMLCHNFWTLNVKRSIFAKNGGQQPWAFMGDRVKPIIVEEGFDVHVAEDITRTERWLTENILKDT